MKSPTPRPRVSPPTVLLKTLGICLNIRPFSKTSQMVTWLTPDLGRVTTPVKGAQRPKSAFLGKMDLAWTCELVLYAHSVQGVHHLRECTPLVLHEALRSRWRLAETAAYLCDLTMRIAQPHLANPALFARLSEVLEGLPDCRPAELPLVLLWYEVQVLLAAGLAPQFAVCARCAPSPRHTFSVEEGRFVCEHHPSRLTHPSTLLLHEEIAQLFLLLAREPLSALLTQARASTRTDDLGRPEPFPGVFGLRRFLGLFLTTHCDLPPGPRRTILDLLLS